MSLGLKKVQKVKPQSYHVAHNLEMVTFRHKTRSRHLTMCVSAGGWVTVRFFLTIFCYVSKSMTLYLVNPI